MRRNYGQMGAYDLLPGFPVPTLDEIINGAKSGMLSTTAQTVATGSAVKEGAITATGNALGTKIVSFYRNQPIIAYTATAAVLALLFVGITHIGKKRA